MQVVHRVVAVVGCRGGPSLGVLVVDCFDSACDAFGLTINIPKTKVMFQPAPGNPFVKPSIFVKDKLLGDTLISVVTLISVSHC